MSTILRVVLGAVVGAGVGFAVYRFIGCRTGACPLTGNPYISMFIFGLMGVLLLAGK